MKQSVERLNAPGTIRLNATRLAADIGLRCLGGLSISGEENIKDIDGPYVQAADHQSYLDIPVLGVAAHRVDRQQLHYIAKDNLNKPVIGSWLAGGGTMYINRRLGLMPANHEEIEDRARKNAAFAVFPQGHRYPSPIKREQVMGLVAVPMVFEHNLTVVPTGIAGTDSGDIGFFHIDYEQPLKPEPVDFEPDKKWDHRRRTAMLSKAIKAQLGKDAVDCFLEDLYQGMAAAELNASQKRAERMAKRKLTRTILLPLNKSMSGPKQRTLNL